MTMPAPIKVQRGRAPDDNSPHILVIDDDSRIRDLLARYLHEHGFRVTTAVDADCCSWIKVPKSGKGLLIRDDNHPVIEQHAESAQYLPETISRQGWAFEGHPPGGQNVHRSEMLLRL